jgi:hypothetical protein
VQQATVRPLLRPPSIEKKQNTKSRQPPNCATSAITTPSLTFRFSSHLFFLLHRRHFLFHHSQSQHVSNPRQKQPNHVVLVLQPPHKNILPDLLPPLHPPLGRIRRRHRRRHPRLPRPPQLLHRKRPPLPALAASRPAGPRARPAARLRAVQRQGVWRAGHGGCAQQRDVAGGWWWWWWAEQPVGQWSGGRGPAAAGADEFEGGEDDGCWCWCWCWDGCWEGEGGGSC